MTPGLAPFRKGTAESPCRHFPPAEPQFTALPIFRRRLSISSEGWGRDPARPLLLRVVLNVPGVLIKALQGSCCLPRSPGTGGVPAGRVGTGRETAARLALARPWTSSGLSRRGNEHSCRCLPLRPPKGRCQASRLRPSGACWLVRGGSPLRRLERS